MRELKLTVVGARGIGKTCLLKAYTSGVFPQGPYAPTVFPFVDDEEYVYSRLIDYSGRDLLLSLWDQVHSDSADLRTILYQQTDLFLLCFSISNGSSLHSLLDIWKTCNSRIPVLLLGLKKDLRPSVTPSLGRWASEQMGAISYHECSAKTGDGVDQAFATAVQAAMRDLRRKSARKSCNLCPTPRVLMYSKLL